MANKKAREGHWNLYVHMWEWGLLWYARKYYFVIKQEEKSPEGLGRNKQAIALRCASSGILSTSNTWTLNNTPTHETALHKPLVYQGQIVYSS